MNAFILEKLYPTGWRRDGELFWRLCDAETASKRAINSSVRAIRILPVEIGLKSVAEFYAPEEEKAPRRKAAKLPS